MGFVTKQIPQNSLTNQIETQNYASDPNGIQVINSQHQTCEIETIKIIGQSPKTLGTIFSSNNQERKITINSKYSNFIAGRTPAECGNIASNEEEASTSSKISKVSEPTP